MSPLRRRMIEDMQIRNLTANTQRVYVAHLVRFACYFRKSPDLLGPAEIRTYLIHLTRERLPRSQFNHSHGLCPAVFLHRHAQAGLGGRGRHPRRPPGKEASGRAEPGRSRAFPGHGISCLAISGLAAFVLPRRDVTMKSGVVFRDGGSGI
jgi:hypothetical protein